jgi:general secretion pathway protein D
MKKKLAHTLPVTLLVLPASWVLAQPGAQGASEQVQRVKSSAAQGAPATAAPAAATPAKGGQTPPQEGATVKPPITKGVTSTQTKGGPAVRGQGPGEMPGGMPGGMPKPPKPAWKQFKLNPKTTMFLDFTEANADAIISIFSRTSGITILKDPTFKVPLTVTSAKSVKLDEAFEIFNTVLGLNGYELQKQGNLMLVARKQPPQQQPQQSPPPPPQPIVKTYFLKNASATQVAKVIVDIYGPAAGGGGANPQPNFNPGIIRFGGGEQPQFGGGGAPGGPANANFKVTSDDYTNSVIVKAMPAEHTKIEELLKDLDKPTAQPLTTELFVLKFVPAEQAVQAIEDMLTANAPQGRGSGRRNNNSGNEFGFISFGFNPFGPPQRTAGNQSATAIKQTNSVSVNATPENMELIRKLLKNLDQPAVFADNTEIIKLQNAKASDVADLLTKVFAQQRNGNQDGGFFFDIFGDFGNNNRNKSGNSDFDEEGHIVNTRDITGKVNIQADPNTNSIVVVTQPSNMRMIKKVIEKLDVTAEQVVIETVIVEASLDKTTKLGVEYNFIGNLFGGDGVGSQNFGLQTATAADPIRGLQYTLTGKDYKAFLNAVQTDTRFKVLDTPRIFTSNNVKAEINVSQRVPYPDGQQTTVTGPVVTNVRFLDVGVVLNVTPRITANGQVTMDVIQSADDLQGFQTFGNLTAPISNQRKATTTVTVQDGQTIVLGGIIQNTERNTVQKVPFLGDVPLLGNLFRSTTKVKGQTELMVFLTPHIVRTNADAQKIREDVMKDLTKSSQGDLKKIIPPR